MLKINKLLILCCLFSASVFAQKSVNDYKYIVVPSQFEFQKNAGDFQLNELTKFLFNKHGYTAFLSTETYPADYAQNKCLALTAQLRKTSSLMKSKLKYELVDCYNQVVFATDFASSKEKDYKKAYQEGARKAFNKIKFLNYKYNPKVEEKVIVSSKEDQRELIQIKTDDDIIEQKPILEKEGESMKDDVKVVESSDANLLYAQAISNGFQLVDSTPKRVYVIKTTSVKGVYILEGMNGILYNNNGKWIAEYYTDGQFVKKELSIKF